MRRASQSPKVQETSDVRANKVCQGKWSLCLLGHFKPLKWSPIFQLSSSYMCRRLHVSHFITTMIMVNISHVLWCFIFSWKVFQKMSFVYWGLPSASIVHNQNINKGHGLASTNILVKKWDTVTSAKFQLPMCCITYLLAAYLLVSRYRASSIRYGMETYKATKNNRLQNKPQWYTF